MICLDEQCTVNSSKCRVSHAIDKQKQAAFTVACAFGSAEVRLQSKLSGVRRLSAIVPVKIVRHSWEQQVAAVCGLVPVAALVPVFPSIVRIPAL